MALISISGESGCRDTELGRLIAIKLGFELVTEASLSEQMRQDFAVTEATPDRAWPHMARAILARLARERHAVVLAAGAELLILRFPAVLRTRVVAPEGMRVANLMLDHACEREEAQRRLRSLDTETVAAHKNRFGPGVCREACWDLVMNAEGFSLEQMADLLEYTIKSRGFAQAGFLSTAAEAQIQFEVRLKLARYGIALDQRAAEGRREFGHPSEEVFANLLDFYRVPWDYEPRSFPLQWDKDGRVLEAFTPDFYLPEFDLYVELTTMKQAHVTKKNRKIRLLRAIYPHINIQVYYQKDMQDLVLKYGLSERLAR